MPIEILMPALSPTMTEGTLAKWLKKEGDSISSGELIAEIETDKATMEVEAVDEGTLGKILVKEGTQGVPVNQAIALLLEEGEDKKVLDSYKVKATPAASESKENASPKAEQQNTVAPASKPAPVAPQPSRAPTAAPVAPVVTASVSSDRVKASPLARRMAEDAGVNLGQVAGTGPHGRVVKADIEEFLQRGGSGGVVRRHAEEFVQVPHSTMRKAIARRLTESKQTVPHFYLTMDCRIDALLELRKQLNDHAVAQAGDGNKPAWKLSVNDLVIRAAALAIRDVPEVNVSWYDDAMVQYRNVDISVAVATEGGLITPIVQNADQKTLPQLSTEIKSLAARARAGQLKPHEYEGGGFSISNLGMYGIKHFEAIINPPQSCILAIGAGEERAIVRHGEVEAATIMHATLSVDHRAVDGALGAEFLQVFKRYIEAPAVLLL
ncbi:MAG: pyruvate dehydrogenase complex dihydrolipoamide acetyltransferase [Rickettsiales bacterium]|nr:pyruvate dehydrogenase complex dihydrolipoamide acetyltransferase [Rickettsiales bacterium]